MRLRHNIDSNSLMRLMSYCSKIQGPHNEDESNIALDLRRNKYTQICAFF
jgi:hypothetical protein